MLSSITPVGERARRQRWSVTAGAYVFGSLLGGAAIGGLLGSVGWLVLRGLADRTAIAILAMAAVVGLIVDRTTVVPSRRHQVNERWLDTYRGWVYGLGFGFELGVGVATMVPTSITYIALVAALLARSPLAGLAIGATFGLVRGLPILAAGRLDRPELLRSFHRRLAAIGAPMQRGAAGVQLAVAIVAVLTVVGA